MNLNFVLKISFMKIFSREWNVFDKITDYGYMKIYSFHKNNTYTFLRTYSCEKNKISFDCYHFSPNIRSMNINLRKFMIL